MTQVPPHALVVGGGPVAVEFATILTGSGSAVTHLVRGLGLGSHRPERQAFGMSSHNTITRLREHLTLLRSIFDTGAVDFSG